MKSCIFLTKHYLQKAFSQGTPESYSSNQSVNLEKNNPKVFYKKDVFKNLQNSYKMICDGVRFLIRLEVAILQPTTSLKKRVRYRGFLLNFVKFLKSQWSHFTWSERSSSISVKDIFMRIEFALTHSYFFVKKASK